MNAPGDAFEQEADRVADHVMRMPAPAVQRESESEDDEDEVPDIQAKELSIHRVEASAGDAAAGGDAHEAPQSVHEVIGSSGEVLAPDVRSFMEDRVGHDFTGVRVHTDARAAASAHDINALAYTVGNRIVFGAGQYAPGTDSGKRLLAHELTHVVQQGGAVRRTARPEPLRRGAGWAASGSHVARRTATSVQRVPGPSPPQPFVCGPNVTQQFRGALRNIETTFGGWSRRNKLRACQRILIPITPDLQPDINGWDTLPLFQGRSRWLRTPPVYSARRRGPCATPSSSDPSNRSNFAAGHEDPNTCSNSVQFENGCWLNGTVNYATFGVMVRLCAGQFSFSEVVRTGTRRLGLGADLADLAGDIASITGMSLLDWAVRLIEAYKAARGSDIDSADLPVAWVRAFHAGGSTAAPPGGANRSRCATTCALTGARQRWSWVWEPVRRR